MTVKLQTAIDNIQILQETAPQEIVLRNGKIESLTLKHKLFPMLWTQSPDKIKSVEEKSRQVLQEHLGNLCSSLQNYEVFPSATIDLKELKVMVKLINSVQKKFSSKNPMPIVRQLYELGLDKKAQKISARIKLLEELQSEWNLRYPLKKFLTVLNFRYQSVSYKKFDSIPEYLPYAPLVAFAREMMIADFNIGKWKDQLSEHEKNNLDLLLEIIEALKTPSIQGKKLNTALKKQLEIIDWVNNCDPDCTYSSESKHIKTITEKGKPKFRIEEVFCCDCTQGERMYFKGEIQVKVDNSQ